MGKKKGAVAAKARAKKQAAAGGGADGATAAPSAERLVHEDGCRVHRGLQNLGNTCYMNSIVQCLNVSQPFSDLLLAAAPPTAGGMAETLAAVFRGIRAVDSAPGAASAGGTFNPKGLQQQLASKFPWFRGKQQQDAHEFLRTLLGSVSDEFEQAGAKLAGPTGSRGPAGDGEGAAVEGPVDQVSSNFSGRMCGLTLCWGCGGVSFRMDPFLDLPLHLPALGGQAAKALGVTPSRASGEPEPLPAGFDGKADAPSDCDGDAAAGEFKPGKSGKKKAGATAPAAAEPAAQAAVPKPLRGVWGAAREREELLDGTRGYLAALLGRLLALPADDAVTESEAEAEEAQPVPEQYEVELSRPSTGDRPSWGLRWLESRRSDGEFVVCGVVEDSLVDNWNLKRLALGDAGRAVRAGDRLVEANEQSGNAEVADMLRKADKLTLLFERLAGLGAHDAGGPAAESDGEAERRAEVAKAVVEAREAYCKEADRCYDGLSAELRGVFGPAPATPQMAKVAERIPLEHCLRHFSGAEALEDDYKPVYTCIRCAKADRKAKTFASRRMWLCSGGLPELLTLQLKRFRRYGDRLEKSAASVALPPVLDFASYVLGEDQMAQLEPFVVKGLEDVRRFTAQAASHSLEYELYGMCVHQGNSMKAGHYIAYVNAGAGIEDARWFGISDSKTWRCEQSEVLKAEAYVAFYRRKGASSSIEVQTAEGADASDAHAVGAATAAE